VLLREDIAIGVCPPGQPECDVTLEMLHETPTHTPTPQTETVTPILTPTIMETLITPTATPGYPCEAVVISNTGATSLRVLRQGPGSQFALSPRILQANLDIVVKTNSLEPGRTIWYQITDLNGMILGWISSENLRLSASCP
jgi:hypothetical protein